jgi:hypothetical protein
MLHIPYQQTKYFFNFSLLKFFREESTGVEDVAGGDMVLDVEREHHVEDTEEESFTGPGITQITSMDDSESVLKQEKVIACEEQLLKLAHLHIDDKCQVKGCAQTVEVSTKYVASALYIVWVCTVTFPVEYDHLSFDYNQKKL